MEEKCAPIVNTCNFSGIRPIMMDLPYPDIAIKEKNLSCANLLSNDYCGAVSEMSAITQYLNNENRLSCEKCPMAKTILGIAMAEMMHFQKLGEMIVLLGGTVDFTAVLQNGKKKMWTPEYLMLPDHAKKMLYVGIESEKAAIKQYRMHIKMINDPYINAVLERIILDEEYHILILQNLAKEIS